jgi:hypothetical protein
MTRQEELISMAKERFPIGVSFLSTFTANKCIVIDDNFTIQFFTDCGDCICNSNGGWVYSDHVGWAKIVSHSIVITKKIEYSIF